ncbi:hypothetical protein MEX01_16600 [Methylorubrum extorquens]|nr:hypothetical protein MEX01_16600 [Methylorubrum extorquens]
MNKPADPRTRTVRAEDEARLTRQKFKLLEVASTDERLKPGEFRFFSRLLKHLDKGTWTATVGDERMIAEVPKCGDSSVCNSHRKALASHGWLTYEPGNGKRATVYSFPQEPPYEAIMKLDARQRALSDRREERGFRPQNQEPVPGGGPTQGWATNQPRGGQRLNPGVGGGPGIPCIPSLDPSQEDPSDQREEPGICAECDEPSIVRADDGWYYCRGCADRYGLHYERSAAIPAAPEDGD